MIFRFDREDNAERLHFISAATLLGTDDITSGSYQAIAVQIKRYGAQDSVKRDLEQLFRRMVFNILCNNTDDHLRNHGFLYKQDQGWVLSPAYDIVPQRDMGSGEKRQLTLGVEMDGSRAATLENAISSCTVFGLSKKDGKKIVDQMKAIFLSTWETTYQDCNVPQKDLLSLSESFTKHLL